MEYNDEHSGGTTGTLPAFRRENARKAQNIQGLVNNVSTDFFISASGFRRE